MPRAGAPFAEVHGLLLAALLRYARELPEAVAAGRFDFCKLCARGFDEAWPPALLAPLARLARAVDGPRLARGDDPAARRCRDRVLDAVADGEAPVAAAAARTLEDALAREGLDGMEVAAWVDALAAAPVGASFGAAWDAARDHRGAFEGTSGAPPPAAGASRPPRKRGRDAPAVDVLNAYVRRREEVPEAAPPSLGRALLGAALRRGDGDPGFAPTAVLAALDYYYAGRGDAARAALAAAAPTAPPLVALGAFLDGGDGAGLPLGGGLASCLARVRRGDGASLRAFLEAAPRPPARAVGRCVMAATALDAERGAVSLLAPLRSLLRDALAVAGAAEAVDGPLFGSALASSAAGPALLRPLLGDVFEAGGGGARAAALSRRCLDADLMSAAPESVRLAAVASARADVAAAAGAALAAPTPAAAKRLLDLWAAAPHGALDAAVAAVAGTVALAACAGGSRDAWIAAALARPTPGGDAALAGLCRGSAAARAKALAAPAARLRRPSVAEALGAHGAAGATRDDAAFAAFASDVLPGVALAHLDRAPLCRVALGLLADFPPNAAGLVGAVPSFDCSVAGAAYLEALGAPLDGFLAHHCAPGGDVAVARRLAVAGAAAAPESAAAAVDAALSDPTAAALDRARYLAQACERAWDATARVASGAFASALDGDATRLPALRLLLALAPSTRDGAVLRRLALRRYGATLRLEDRVALRALQAGGATVDGPELRAWAEAASGGAAAPGGAWLFDVLDREALERAAAAFPLRRAAVDDDEEDGGDDDGASADGGASDGDGASGGESGGESDSVDDDADAPVDDGDDDDDGAGPGAAGDDGGGGDGSDDDDDDDGLSVASGDGDGAAADGRYDPRFLLPVGFAALRNAGAADAARLARRAHEGGFLAYAVAATASAPGQEKGDSSSLQHECSARARSGKSIHASRALRGMIARPKISRNE